MPGPSPVRERRSVPESPSQTTPSEPVRHRRCPDPRERARRLARNTLLAAFGIVFLLWTVVVMATLTERRMAIESARVEADNLSAAFAEQVRQVMRSTVSTMDLLEQRMRIEGKDFDLLDWARQIPELAAPTIQGSIIGPDGKLIASTLMPEQKPVEGSLIGPDGKVVASTSEPSPAPIDLSDRPHFRIHIQNPHYGIYIGQPVLGRVSKRVTIQVSKRLESATGAFLGVLVFSLDPEQLTTLHRDVDLGAHGVMVLAGTDGVIRARFGRMIPKEPMPEIVSLAGTPFFTAGGGAAHATYITPSKVDGIDRLFSRRRVEGYPLVASVGLALDEVFIPADRHALELAGISIAATIILLVGAGMLAVQIRSRAEQEASLAAANVELAESKARAESANEAKSRFLANMSHELRTPLNAIIGLSQVMRDQLLGALPKRYLSYAENITGSGEHLLGIINDVLDISRIEAGKIVLDERVFDVADLVRGSLPAISPQATQRGISLALDLAPDLPPIRGDENRLRQVLLNLLSNAVKFTPGGGSIRIEAHLERNGSLSIAVIDTGIGMAPDEIEIAQQRFRQVDDGMSKRFGGAGLGLPIAKELLAMHGGSLEIASALGAGTAARMRLPATRVTTAAEMAALQSA